MHLGTGSTHEYDPRDPHRYNVTTFGESEIPVEISSPVDRHENRGASDAERSVSQLLAEHGPNWRDARVEFHRRIAFPAACLVFALLGVPIGVRPRRGGRAAGLILTLVLIGGYYFLFVTGAHMAQQGSIAPWAGIWAANIAAMILGLIFLRRIESVRKPNRDLWRGSIRLAPFAPGSRREAEAAPIPVSNGPVVKRTWRRKPRPAARHAKPAGMIPSLSRCLIDVYLLQRFFYYFLVLLAGFVSDLRRFHAFRSSRRHLEKSHPGLDGSELFPLPGSADGLPACAAGHARRHPGHSRRMAKNNEVIAFKASGISLYRLVLPLTLAGCVVAGSMFLLDDTYLPYANQRQDALRNQIKGRPPQTYFQPAHQWIFGENSKIYNYELFDPDQQLFGGLSVFELDPDTFQIRRRVFATRATWEPSENTWVLTGGWIRDFDTAARSRRYTPFKVESLPEISEPPSYFRREVRQSYQMNWRQLGEYILSLAPCGIRYCAALRAMAEEIRLPADCRDHRVSRRAFRVPGGNARRRRRPGFGCRHCDRLLGRRRAV